MGHYIPTVLEYPSEQNGGTWTKNKAQLMQFEASLRIHPPTTSQLHVDFVNQLKGVLSLQWGNYSSSVTC